MSEQSGNGLIKIVMRNGVMLKEPEYVHPQPAPERSIYNGRRPQDKKGRAGRRKKHA